MPKRKEEVDVELDYVSPITYGTSSKKPKSVTRPPVAPPRRSLENSLDNLAQAGRSSPYRPGSKASGRDESYMTNINYSRAAPVTTATYVEPAAYLEPNEQV